MNDCKLELENNIVEYILSLTPDDMKQEVEINLRMKLQDLMKDYFITDRG